jgi:hypothetical protein
MILGFKQQFPNGRLTHFRRKIEQGIKIHSVREDAHDRWHAGRVIQMSHGVRTKHFHCFAQMLCTGTQKIEIKCRKHIYLLGQSDVKVDGRELDLAEINQLAINDGFDNLYDFLDFFPKCFKGKIIHWTLYRY